MKENYKEKRNNETQRVGKHTREIDIKRREREKNLKKRKEREKKKA